MGLFQGKHKKPDQPLDESSDGVRRFFDDYFAELRRRGAGYFESTVETRVSQFKDDLDTTVVRANADLKKYLMQRLDEEFAKNTEAINSVQAAALKSFQDGARQLEQQQEHLLTRLQKSVVDQEATLTKLFDGTHSRVGAIEQAQEAALKSLQESVVVIGEQQRKLVTEMENTVAARQSAMMENFETNMSQVIEHYLMGALGDQYDLNAQLPAIIKQMEANRQAIEKDLQA